MTKICLKAVPLIFIHHLRMCVHIDEMSPKFEGNMYSWIHLIAPKSRMVVCNIYPLRFDPN